MSHVSGQLACGQFHNTVNCWSEEGHSFAWLCKVMNQSIALVIFFKLKAWLETFFSTFQDVDCLSPYNHSLLLDAKIIVSGFMFSILENIPQGLLKEN